MSTEIKAWKCEKCGKAWLNKDTADRCCRTKTEYKCRVCGSDTQKGWLICPECRDKERFEKARKIKYSEYEIGYLWDEVKQEYFPGKEELEEKYYEDFYDGNGAGEPEYPSWCYGCIEMPFKISLDTALEHAEEEMCEDFEVEKSAVDLKGLLDYVKEWNAKQTAKAYDVDYSTVVLLNE